MVKQILGYEFSPGESTGIQLPRSNLSTTMDNSFRGFWVKVGCLEGFLPAAGMRQAARSGEVVE
jgi:hypothetical protein